LLEELRASVRIRAFTDFAFGDADAPAGVNVHDIRAFDAVERAFGPYDQIFLCIGNSEHHVEALRLLRRRSAVVLAHDVRLTGLYAYAASQRPDVEPRRFRDVIEEMYGDRVPRTLGAKGFLEPDLAQLHGVLMAREALERSQRFLVHSEYAAQLARLDARPEDVSKVAVVPFAFPQAERTARRVALEEPLVATFGVVAAVKQPMKLLEAFERVLERHARAKLAVVGRVLDPREEARLRTRALERGISHRVRFTGHVSEDEFRAWIGRTTVAVQLRAVSQGESPASVTDTLSAGVATVVSRIGAAGELPDACVVKVSPDITPEELAEEISSLLADDARRQELERAAVAYAREHTFADAAKAVLGAAGVHGPGRASTS
jgi:glycosyltransferase involved in cell wall biosynthesis